MRVQNFPAMWFQDVTLFYADKADSEERKYVCLDAFVNFVVVVVVLCVCLFAFCFCVYVGLF